MINVIAIFIGGGIGSVLRYLTCVVMLQCFNTSLPAATFVVNFVGSLILGLLFAIFVDRPEINPALKVALTVGFCGGLTTFSTFSFELFEMIRNAEFIQAIVYTLLSVIICIVAVSLGVYLAKFI